MRNLCLIGLLLLATSASAQPNTWQQLEAAKIEGRRSETPLGYSPELKKFLVLGGRTNSGEYKKPRSFDQLALDPNADAKTAQWENWFPANTDWGPKFGACTAPPWKGEKWEFTDSAGNTRPNWMVYGTFSLGHAYDYDPDTKTFLFFAKGKTFRYDPAARSWTDLKPDSNPESELGGTLLWSSLCYDRKHQQFVLFGGGNLQTDRGDPGTWIYSPEKNTWSQLELKKQPPQRANSQLVYDPIAQKVILFGGDQLHQLIADTWAFDLATREWQEVKTARAPSPRAGHALLWLPKAQKVLLLGGYTYTSDTGYVANMFKPLPFEAWTFDTTTGTWELLQRFAAKEAPQPPNVGFLHAAADENDVVVATGNGTWRIEIEATKTDAAGTEKFAGKSTDVVRRTGPHDPAWFTQDVPAADPDVVKKDLAALPANEWVLRPTPKLPRPNMDWGSAVFLPEQDLIVRFSGGHSAYSGTAPIVYDIKTDRYSLPFAPELPLEFVYSNDQVDGEWSFQQNPWMSGHTYKTTGYDPLSQSLIYAAHDYTYFYSPTTRRWTRDAEKCPFNPNMYVVTLATTKDSVVAWADKRGGSGAGLWRLEGKTQTWQPLPLQGTLPDKSPDRHGMAYDSQRDRLLFFSAVGKQKGDVASYDLKTGAATWLDPAGKSQAAVSSRETIYLPEQDAVLIGARVKDDDGKFLWTIYDCAKNAWFGVELTGADPISKGEFNNSMGLMVDPARKLIWAVGQNSHVHVLRLDLKSARIVPLK
ncbi:Kelch repeat-containing protein [Anatilimnocola floriformis]|uniref:Kelch repeat-containing protein n=1 Tax=Anatilimnocola floriformis TaxID=2948575 RepID=UPI0020C259C9|nr:kelch repeat-containing protein [Anatilimnocola floriformis]